MRHSTADFDLESPLTLARLTATGKVTKGIPTNLRAIDVYVLGSDGAGRPLDYWESLRRFWADYFLNSGAVLKTYSVLREVPVIAEH